MVEFGRDGILESRVQKLVSIDYISDTLVILTSTRLMHCTKISVHRKQFIFIIPETQKKIIEHSRNHKNFTEIF